jgi:hypothetical protein
MPRVGSRVSAAERERAAGWVVAVTPGGGRRCGERVNVRQGEPVSPGQVTADVPWLPEGPDIGDPAGHQRVQGVLETGADLAIHHPSADLGIGALLFRRVNVNAAEQGSFGVVEQCVIKRLVGRDLCFVAGQVLPVLLVSHRSGRPAPRGPEN